MPESQVHSFIVKLWLEKVGDDSTTGVWRGYITHVPDGKRRYLRTLRDIISFVKSYIGESGPDVMHGSRTRLWLRQLTRWRR